MINTYVNCSECIYADSCYMYDNFSGCSQGRVIDEERVSTKYVDVHVNYIKQEGNKEDD